MDQSGRRLDAVTWTPVLSQDSVPDNGLHRAEVYGVGVVLCRTDAGSLPWASSARTWLHR